MQFRGEEVTTEEVCESLVRHLEVVGDDVFEKNYVLRDGSIAASVFVIVGPNAEDMTALVREWMTSNGFERNV